MSVRRTRVGLAVLAAAGTCGLAGAQAPINSNVALQPSKGGIIIRQQFRHARADLSSPSLDIDISLTTSITTLVYGLTESVTLIADQPAVLSRRTEDRLRGHDASDSGFGDLRLLSKIRLHRDDFGPTDTSRFDLIAGLEAPTGNEEFSSESFDPIVGGVLTHVHGRHAFDADLLWQLNTGGGERGTDTLQYDAAYLYRLSPERYASLDPTALFGALELNGSYETNGDHELFLSPGIQFVTTRWIVEATVQVPIWQDLDHRPERDFVVGLGLRIQF